jgi:hypothetical protein
MALSRGNFFSLHLSKNSLQQCSLTCKICSLLIKARSMGSTHVLYELLLRELHADVKLNVFFDNIHLIKDEIHQWSIIITDDDIQYDMEIIIINLLFFVVK